MLTVSEASAGIARYRLQFRPEALAEWKALAACRTLGVDSENGPQRGQFLPNSQPHSGTMGQEDGEKWAAAAHSQPTIPKSDRLLDGSVKEVLRKLLKKRLEQPRLPGAELHGDLRDCYKIKLLRQGYRLVYQVRDDVLVVLVLAVSQREDMKVYRAAVERLLKKHHG